MVKKILSATLVLALALSVVGTLQMTSFAAATVTIDDMPGAVVRSQDFDGTGENSVEGKTLTQLGYTESDTGAYQVSDFQIVTVEKDGNASNKSVVAAARVAYSYATAEEKAQIDTGAYKLGTVNAMYLSTGEGATKREYLITKDTSEKKSWYNVDGVTPTVADGVTTYAEKNSLRTNAKNMWFYANGNPYLCLEAGKDTGSLAEAAQSTLSIPAPAVEKDGTGRIKGVITYSFNTMNPRLDTWNGEDGQAFLISGIGATNQFYFRKEYIRIDVNHCYININGSAVSKSMTGSSDCFLANNIETFGTQPDTTSLKKFYEVDKRDGGEWHNVIVVLDYDNAIYKLYYDGKPVYFYEPVDKKYHDEFVIQTPTALPDFKINTPRMNYYQGNEPYFDDIVVKYAANTNRIVNSDLAKTNVSLANSDGKDAYMGVAIRANIPEGTFNKMKWVFNTETDRFYSTNVAPLVSASGEISFAAVFKNGDVVDNAIVGAKDIIGVDAIFDIGGVNYFTNMIDASYFNRP